MVIKKDSKSGQAEIITTVLIILMVLVAIIIVWNVVKFSVVRSAENIGTSTFTTQLKLENVEMYITGGASIKLHREAGAGNITKLKFIFYDSNGESHTIEKDGSDENCKIPGELETQICSFSSSEVNFEVVKVSVVPMFGKNAGMEIKEDDLKTDLPVSGLVSWWKFDGNTKDSVGGNDGTVYDGAQIIEGILILRGDGSEDRVTVSNFNYEIMKKGYETSSWSISVWAKPAGAQVGGQNMIIGRTGCHGGIEINGEDNSFEFALYDNDCLSRPMISWTPVSFNNWHNIVIVYDNKEMRLYGDKIVTGPITFTPNLIYDYTNMLYFGGIQDSYNFNGSIDDVMIFNKSLSVDEITAIYNNQKQDKI